MERIERGDYALRKLPSEMELAEETGVSRMTARRALTHLIDEGVFRRGRNRRLEIASPGGRGRVHQFAFLMPPVISEDVQAWQWAAEQAVGAIKGVLRPIVYTDWNDVLLSGALKGFDGIFLMQTGFEIPDAAIGVLRNSPNPVVSLDLDLSERGIPSLWLFPEQAVWRLLDHLRKLGHRRIACFHTCHMNRVFQQRIVYWRNWKDQHGLGGELFNLPGRQGSHHGLTAGREISLCAINDEMLAPWITPSLTSLRMPDPSDMLGTCVRWMANGGRDWQGPRLLVPGKVPLFHGESTGPAPR
jgi:hypothetical protein